MCSSDLFPSHDSGDWIVHVNIPEWGKCTAAQVISTYEFDKEHNSIGKAYVAADQIGRYKRSFYVPLAIWEVVPYSFVVDWFVNVSDYIQAYRKSVGQNEVICSVISFSVVGTATLKLEDPIVTGKQIGRAHV